VQTVEAMFGYMTELETVDIDESKTQTVEVQGDATHAILLLRLPAC
jgi:hypothetical protein